MPGSDLPQNVRMIFLLRLLYKRSTLYVMYFAHQPSCLFDLNMQRALAVFIALAVVLVVVACPGEEHDHVHDYRKREYPQVPLTPPSRPLEWSDVK